MRQGVLGTWGRRLPLASSMELSLGEGDTPLLEAKNFCARHGLEIKLYVKFEGMNPTGSFKDRGMVLAVAAAKAKGMRATLCASTGNTSASAAAYSARAGMASIVLVPEGKISRAKLLQAAACGAQVIEMAGNFDDAMRAVQRLVQVFPLALVNSVNPYRLQGQKTAAFEVAQALGKMPDMHALPVGNAGNISANWLGYLEWTGRQAQGYPAVDESYAIYPETAGTLPKMLGYQAAGAAPLVQGAPVLEPQTVASAIRIGAPQSAHLAQAVRQASGGWFVAVEDREILWAQRALAESEGIFCEPASAASVAGIVKDFRGGKIAEGALVVATLTGHGLKDPDAVEMTGRRLFAEDEKALFQIMEKAL